MNGVTYWLCVGIKYVGKKIPWQSNTCHSSALFSKTFFPLFYLICQLKAETHTK